jgi:ribosomal protein S24E
MNIKQNLRNELLKRNEIVFEIKANKNPSFAEAKNMIVEEFKCSTDTVDVYRIKGNFGKDSFTISSYVYDDSDSYKKSIQKTKKQLKEEKKQYLDSKKAEFEAKNKPLGQEDKSKEEEA